jgi:hypothetical protein
MGVRKMPNENKIPNVAKFATKAAPVTIQPRRMLLIA